jgi:hypothetical protein
MILGANIALTRHCQSDNTRRVTAKTRMAGIRANETKLANWARKARAAGMSLNKWACLVLDNAPEVKPAAIVKSMT